MGVTVDVLEEICDSCPRKEEYCLLKEMIAHSGINDKTAIQFKLVEKFKYEESERQQRNIGWQDAWKLWVERGYAKQFTTSYHWSKPYKRLYREIMGNYSE